MPVDSVTERVVHPQSLSRSMPFYSVAASELDRFAEFPVDPPASPTQTLLGLSAGALVTAVVVLATGQIDATKHPTGAAVMWGLLFTAMLGTIFFGWTVYQEVRQASKVGTAIKQYVQQIKNQHEAAFHAVIATASGSSTSSGTGTATVLAPAAGDDGALKNSG